MLAPSPWARTRITLHDQARLEWLPLEAIAYNACIAENNLMNGSLGMAGQRCMASLFFVSGSKMARDRREAGLELARQVVAGHALGATAGATCPNEQVMVLRLLAPLVEPAADLLRQVWQVWRQHFWQLPATDMPATVT